MMILGDANTYACSFLIRRSRRKRSRRLQAPIFDMTVMMQRCKNYIAVEVSERERERSLSSRHLSARTPLLHTLLQRPLHHRALLLYIYTFKIHFTPLQGKNENKTRTAAHTQTRGWGYVYSSEENDERR